MGTAVRGLRRGASTPPRRSPSLSPSPPARLSSLSTAPQWFPRSPSRTVRLSRLRSPWPQPCPPFQLLLASTEPDTASDRFISSLSIQNSIQIENSVKSCLNHLQFGAI